MLPMISAAGRPDPATSRDPDTLADLLLQARRCRRDQVTRREVQQEHRSGIGGQHVLGPLQQLRQQVLIVKARECRVRHRVNVTEPVLKTMVCEYHQTHASITLAGLAPTG